VPCVSAHDSSTTTAGCSTQWLPQTTPCSAMAAPSLVPVRQGVAVVPSRAFKRVLVLGGSVSLREAHQNHPERPDVSELDPRLSNPTAPGQNCTSASDSTPTSSVLTSRRAPLPCHICLIRAVAIATRFHIAVLAHTHQAARQQPHSRPTTSSLPKFLDDRASTLSPSRLRLNRCLHRRATNQRISSVPPSILHAKLRHEPKTP